MLKIKSHDIGYSSNISKYPNSFEKINWRKTLKIYYFYNNILNSRLLIFLNIILLNKFLINYFISYIKYSFLLSRLDKNKIFGFYSKYRDAHIVEIFKKEIKIFYEFGSGASTILIALQLYNQHISKGVKGKLYTFDQSKEWIQSVKKKFPPHLLKYVNFQVSDLEYIEKKNIKFLKYKNVYYKDNIDAVLIDGPATGLIKNFLKAKTICNYNLFELLKMKKAKFMFTDKRFYHFYSLKEIAKKNYNFKINEYFRSIEYYLIKK